MNAITHHQFQEHFQEFVKNNVKHLTCKIFAPDPRKKLNAENVCGCGRPLDWHTEQNLLSELKGEKWDPELHTTSTAPSSFGEVEFCSFGVQNNFAKYVRIQHDISTETLRTLLLNVWGLPTPKLVISVTGGARKLQLKPRLQHAFTQGLIDVASTTDAWIISAGMSAGVMQWVGQAVYEHKLANRHFSTKSDMVALAIAPWGCVSNSKSLTGDEYVGCFPAQYSLHNCNDKGKVPLDHNHTHFLLVDNGTDSIFGTEISFRARIEAQIAATVPVNSTVKIPVVMLVCEGGEKTLETVWDATAQHDIPAVIMKGSGRAADILCSAYKSTSPRKRDDSLTHFGDNFDETISNLIAVTFGWKEDKADKIAKCLREIRDLLSKRNLITIFELDDSTCRDLDKAVLTALLKANRVNAENQISLALTWDRSDIAKQYIFTMENRLFWQQFSLNESMLDALLKERCDFVQLFLENGINLAKFLTQDRLKFLYLSSLSDESCRMAPIIKTIIRKSSVYNTFCWFRCNQIDESEQDDLILSNIEKVLRCLFDDKFAYVDLTHTVPDDTVSLLLNEKPLENLMNLNQVTVRMDPYMDLFTWCLLFNKKSLAQFFWKSCKDPIGGALFACNLFKALSVQAQSQEEIDLSADLAQQAELYENMASDILNICYMKDKTSAQSLLTRKLDKSWLGTTLFSLAENASLMKFMQLSCCQTKLNKIWAGFLTENTPEWKIMLSLIPGFILLLRFQNTDDGDTEEIVESDNEPEQQETSINDEKQKSWNGVESSNMKKKHKKKKKKKKQKFFYTTLAFCSGTSSANESQSIGLHKAYYQYFSAPVTKFYCHTVSYVIFLTIFTYVTLAELRPLEEVSVSRYVELGLWIWVCTLWVEEIRQILMREAKSLGFKVIDHFSSFWNQLDFFMFAFFIASILLRHVGSYDDQIMHCKITYALSLMLAYLRLMERFNVSKVLGPKIVAIQKMLRDLLVFVCLLAVFMLSFGVAMQAILYSNRPFDHKVFLQAVYSPYWQTFGGANVARAEGHDDNSCSDNATEIALNPDLHLCPRHGYLVPALLAIYILLTNVLLLNLLIAMFSNTFQKIQDNSEKLWRFNRYSLIKTYYDAPSLPAPFIIFGHVSQLILYLCGKKIKKKFHIRNVFAVSLSDHENSRLSAIEKAGQETYLATNDRLSLDSIDSRLTFTKQKLDQALDQLDEIRDKLSIDQRLISGTTSTHECSVAKIEPSLDVNQRLSMIENQLEKQNKTLQMLVCALDKKLNILE